MERILQPVPFFISIVDNLQVMTGTKQRAGEHAGKSRDGDVLSQHIRPFKRTVNANLFEVLLNTNLDSSCAVMAEKHLTEV